jgi:hypothetical protein
MTATSDLGAAALAYAERGWHVFPLKAGRKEPDTPHGHLDATSDPALIRAWWAATPNAGIGLALKASGLAAIDCDPRNGGDETYVEIANRVGELNGAPTSLTGGGGWHRLYQAPEGVTLHGRGGIDVKTDGYIVVPPSVHPSGRAYAWEVSEHLEDVPIGPMPAAWVTELAKLPSNDGRAGDGDRYQVPPRIASGSIDLELTRVAGSLRAIGMSPAEIADTLAIVNRERADDSTHGPRDFDRIARSMSRYEAGEHGGIVIHGGRICPHCSGWDRAAECLRGHLTIVSGAARDHAGGEAIDLAELATQDIEPIPDSLPFLGADHVIYVGAANLLFAYGKVGKTTALAHSLPDWIDRGHRVLYLTEENRRAWQYRLRRERLTMPPGIRMVFGRRLDSSDLLALATAADEDVIVIDTSRHLLRIDDENDNGKVAKALRPWVNLAEDGRTIAICHHENKTGGAHGRGASGAGAWTSEPDWISELSVVGDPETSTKRKVHSFGRYNDDQWLAYERLEDGRFTTGGVVHKASDGAGIERDARVLGILRDNEPLTFKAWEARTGLTHGTFTRVFSRLRDCGRIEPDDGSGWRIAA